MANLMKKVKVGKNQPINISAPNNNALKAKADRIYQPKVGNMVVQDKFGNVIDAGFSASELQNTLEDLQEQIGTLDNLTTTSKSNLVSAVNELDSDIGNLNNLTTTAKNNVVAAINEVDSDISTINTTIGNKNNLSTTATNLVGAINEVKSIADSAVSNASIAYHFKGTKATVSALPSSGNQIGDVWNVGNDLDGGNYAWTGSAWDKLGDTVDLSNYVTHSELENAVGTDNEAFKGVSASKSGNTTTLTFTKGDNTTSSVSFTDNDTTYDDSTVVHTSGTASANHIVIDGNSLQVDPTTHKLIASFTAQLDFEQVTAFFKSGSGLVVDSTANKVYFDPNQMDTTAFNNLLTALNLPKYITADSDSIKNFYVDGVNGNDNYNGDDIGTVNHPFKTIKACTTYIGKRCNLHDLKVNVLISSGTYDENQVSLPAYTRTSAVVTLKPATANDTVYITSNASNVLNVTGPGWAIEDLNITLKTGYSNDATTIYRSVIDLDNCGTFFITRCNIKVGFNTNTAFAGKGRVVIRGINVGSNCNIRWMDSKNANNLVLPDDNLKRSIAPYSTRYNAGTNFDFTDLADYFSNTGGTENMASCFPYVINNASGSLIEIQKSDYNTQAVNYPPYISFVSGYVYTTYTASSLASIRLRGNGNNPLILPKIKGNNVNYFINVPVRTDTDGVVYLYYNNEEFYKFLIPASTGSNLLMVSDENFTIAKYKYDDVNNNLLTLFSGATPIWADTEATIKSFYVRSTTAVEEIPQKEDFFDITPVGTVLRRYNLTEGATASVGDSNFFPGYSAGTIETATYAWYK